MSRLWKSAITTFKCPSPAFTQHFFAWSLRSVNSTLVQGGHEKWMTSKKYFCWVEFTVREKKPPRKLHISLPFQIKVKSPKHAYFGRLILVLQLKMKPLAHLQNVSLWGQLTGFLATYDLLPVVPQIKHVNNLRCSWTLLPLFFSKHVLFSTLTLHCIGTFTMQKERKECLPSINQMK